MTWYWWIALLAGLVAFNVVIVVIACCVSAGRADEKLGYK